MNARHTSAFHPAFHYLIFHGIVFVVRPFFGYYYEFNAIYDAVKFSPTEEDKINAILAANLAFICFYAVTMVLGKSGIPFKQSVYDLRSREFLKNPFIVSAIPLTVLGVASLIWFWNFKETGESVNMVDLRTGHTALTGVNGYFLSSGSMLAVLSAMFIFLNRFKFYSFLPFIAFAILRLGTGGRGDFVVAAIMIGLLYLYDKRMRWPKFKLVLLGSLVITIFVLVVQDRGYFIRSIFSDDLVQDDGYDLSRLKPFESMDFGNMEFLEYIVHTVPEKTGTYDYFVSNLQIFTEPIPRSIWTDKPVGPPIVRFNLYDWGTSIGMTMSVAGAGWFYMGFAGVFIWSIFFGCLYGWAYRSFVNSAQDNVSVLLYTAFLCTSIISFRDGILLTIFKQLLFYVLPIIAMVLASRMFSIPSASEIRIAHLRAIERLTTGSKAVRKPKLRPRNLW